MATSYKETAKLGHNFKIDGKGPIDVRFVVANKSSLTDGTFTYENSYNMLMVGVEADKSIYVLTNASAPTQSNSWQKLASASDLSELSGVFQFKGVAYAISPDNSYLIVSSDTYSITPLGTACDIVGNIYFGWNMDGLFELWSPQSLTYSSPVYTRSTESTVVYGVTDRETNYFVSASQPEGLQGQLLESLDGRYLLWDNGLGNLEYAVDDYNPYQLYTCDSAGTPTETGITVFPFKYNAYEFTESEESWLGGTIAFLLASDGTKTDGDGKKIPNNTGHVYQIGENEYASNGQIWVKLGSPVEDWIIL